MFLLNPSTATTALNSQPVIRHVCWRTLGSRLLSGLWHYGMLHYGMLTCSTLQESYITTTSLKPTHPSRKCLRGWTRAYIKITFCCRTFFSSSQCSLQRELVTSSFLERSARFYEAVKQNMREEDMMWWRTKDFFVFWKLLGMFVKMWNSVRSPTTKLVLFRTIFCLSVVYDRGWRNTPPTVELFVCPSHPSPLLQPKTHSSSLSYNFNRENHWTVNVWVL